MTIGRRRPTLDDVAREARVSKSTVSRVINAHAYVTDDARQAVIRAIGAIGYVPNHAARSLRTNTTMTVGLVVTRIRNEVFASIAQALDQTLMAAGRTLLAGSSADDPQHERRVVEAFLRRGVDGLVIAFADERASEVQHDLRAAAIPIVLLDRGSRGLVADRILCGHREGIAAALAELRRRGHERVGMITPPWTIRPGREVRDAFLELGGDPMCIRSGILTEDLGRRAAADLKSRAFDVTAVIVSGTEVLVGFLDTLRQRGIAVPDDVSIVAYDESPAARLHSPPISTLAREAERMGELAGTMILERLAGYAGPPRTVVVPTRFIARDSVGGVRGPSSGDDTQPARPGGSRGSRIGPHIASRRRASP